MAQKSHKNCHKIEKVSQKSHKTRSKSIFLVKKIIKMVKNGQKSHNMVQKSHKNGHKIEKVSQKSHKNGQKVFSVKETLLRSNIFLIKKSILRSNNLFFVKKTILRLNIF